MKRIGTFFLCLAFVAACKFSQAQNSVLVNFGSSTCSVSTQPSFTLIKNPLGVTPILLSDCSMTTQLPDFFSVFVAYNPKNNKIYIADVRSGIQTKIWVLDIGLPSQIGCPITIPATPTYTYSYVSNNFEFDNNGDLWSFSNFNSFTGQCNLDKFDVNTGLVINSRTLQFPTGNFPNTISSGDLCILPNGRMFATLGAGPSRLYEITNYSGNTTANATFLTQLPQDCFGIAYLNGLLEVTGNDFSAGCYYFDYNISTGVLGTQKPFQVGNSPIDNTSFTPAIGCTKRLLNANPVNSNTYDLTYEIYVENMGNVILNNLNITDNLTATFGAGNVSNVQASFVSGFNAANLALNPSFNGTSNTSLLAANQNLPNRILLNTDYLFKIQISCRATNLQPNITYLNRAICTGNIGASNVNTLVNVIDSSNNGTSSAVDPNNNGNANEFNENIPTPFSFGLVPVKFIGVSATLVNNRKSSVLWQVATPMINAQKFEVEFSKEGRNWQSIGSIAITNNRQGNYQFDHPNLPEGMLYYRIKQTDIDGSFIYSNIVLLRNNGTGGSLVIYPNPADQYCMITLPGTRNKNFNAVLYDITGRLIQKAPIVGNTLEIPTEHLPDGTYLLQVFEGTALINTHKLLVQHR